ncbi:uncharacterized protein Z518_06878 [Rhinocladiella mackenziei CBS 650.93]|uniref:Uncharacterized protein n=1 Tax=Rhinocladiella mackenziei CBS 650.93 TaxID=1442369 RepID=A0A0D2IJ79_9EURO|nr:uncharacterized protein Z518_06878 [Rhinocladiella mackenziei CBS 650.93]KIX03326.1 hypothetical protein Z518_06878 [Rhinocladiella mackenziei CBS 650.93]
MFVPYDGQSKRFEVEASAQRRYTAQKINREKREKAVRLKQRLDSESRQQHLLTPYVPSSCSPPESQCSLSTDDGDSVTGTNSPPRALTPEDTGFDSTTPSLPGDGDTDFSQSDHHESIALSISTKLRSISKSDMVFGGLRTDPFRSYPIEWREYFPAVLDFAREAVAPRPRYFQYIMEHDVLFEAIVTYVLCVMPNKTPQAKLAMMCHYGGTLSKVSKSLSSATEASSEAVIIAIANLAVICAFCGDDRRFDTHCRGIDRLVEMRGGQKAVEEEDGWLKSTLTAIEALAHIQAPKQAPRTTTAADPPSPMDSEMTPPPSPKISSRVPVYPSHPFSPDLCAMISNLPEGFRELALTGSLSVQLMSRLSITRSQVVHLMATATNDDRDRDWQSLLLASTPIERMGWLAVLVYHLRSSTYVANCRDLAKVVLECARVGTTCPAEMEWLLWGACLFLATPDPDKMLTRERETILKVILRLNRGLTFEQMVLVANKFLWSEGLSMSLKRIMALHRLS